MTIVEAKDTTRLCGEVIKGGCRCFRCAPDVQEFFGLRGPLALHGDEGLTGIISLTRLANDSTIF